LRALPPFVDSFSRFGSDEGGLLLFWLLSVMRLSSNLTNSNSTSSEARRAGEIP
jgi:hypothetical protein